MCLRERRTNARAPLAPPPATRPAAAARSWFVVRIVFSCTAGSYLIYQQRQMVSQLPLWRAAAFVGFYGVGIALNLTWGWKILKGAYKVLMQADRQKGGDVAAKES